MSMQKYLLTSAVFLAMSSSSFAAIDMKVGQEKFDKYCNVCHSKAMSAVMKSPTVHSPDKWMPFIKQAVLESDKQKTTECSKLTMGKTDTQTLTINDTEVSGLSLDEKACYLLPNAKAGVMKGTAVMPPKGTCMDCSDDDLLSAIAFMNKEV